MFFFFSSRRRHTRCSRDWSSDVCSSDLTKRDFLADWGPEGYYGPVKSYEILKATSQHGANAVDIQAAVSPFSPMPDASDQENSRKTKVVSVWVIMSDKSLSFPP